MKTSTLSILSTRRLRFASALSLLSLLLATASGIAENPWTASWGSWPASSSSSHGWSSWETTTGGTFSDPLSSHLSRPSHHGTHLPPAPVAIHNPEIDPVMLKAGSIAENRVQPHSTSFCWRYVKEALVAAGGVNSYPQTAFAKEAGRDLVENHGFVQLSVRRAEQAPVGSVLVYGGAGPGHVELRTTRGFVSDFYCSRPSGLPFIGAFTRLDRHHKEMQTAQLGGMIGSG
jgi:hypothetical protein